MAYKITATEARDRFAEIINRVLYAGEEFVVQRQGKPAALITHINQAQKKRLAKKKTTMNDFFKKLSRYRATGKVRNLAQNHDKYLWEKYSG